MGYCIINQLKFRTILLFLIIASASVYSQTNIKGEKEIQSILAPEVQSKITKSDQLFAKADKYDSKARSYEKEIASLKSSDNDDNSGKIERLEEKRNSNIILSKPIFEDAYKMRYTAYQKQYTILGNEHPVNANVVGDYNAQSNEKYKEAQKLFKKADNTGKTSNQVELIITGRHTFEDAIALQIQAINTLANIKPTNTITEVKKTVPDTTLTAKPTVAPTTTSPKPTVVATPPPTTVATVIAPAAVATTTAVAATVTPAVTTVKESKPPTIVKESELGNVFLTIQIMASTTPATSQQIAAVYKGNFKVMEIQSGEYYRYNVGKFSNTDEAKKFITMNNLKGFVVAYKDSERISVNEALTLINSTK
jgi:hypothetical protein